MKSLGSRLGSSWKSLGERVRRSPLRGGAGSKDKDGGGGECGGAGGAPALQYTETEEEQEAILATLPPEYFEEGFDPLDYELRRLPPNFEAAALEAVGEERTLVLEVRRGWRARSWAGAGAARGAWAQPGCSFDQKQFPVRPPLPARGQSAASFMHRGWTATAALCASPVLFLFYSYSFLLTPMPVKLPRDLACCRW